MSRVWLSGLLALLLPLAACSQEAATTPRFQEGQHYKRLSQPVRTRDSDKIEVVEVFWYGCHHCFDLEPLLKSWLADKPDDVDFRRSPAMWQPVMRVHARAYYTAKALDVLDRVHDPIYEALNLQEQALNSMEDVQRLFADHGVDPAEFEDAWNDFGVKSQVRQADSRARSYGIRGTPELIVDGRYRVSEKMTGSKAAMFEVVDFLIEHIRAQSAATDS